MQKCSKMVASTVNAGFKMTWCFRVGLGLLVAIESKIATAKPFPMSEKVLGIFIGLWKLFMEFICEMFTMMIVRVLKGIYIVYWWNLERDVLFQSRPVAETLAKTMADVSIMHGRQITRAHVLLATGKSLYDLNAACNISSTRTLAGQDSFAMFYNLELASRFTNHPILCKNKIYCQELANCVCEAR